MVKTWGIYKTTETILNKGWRWAAVRDCRLWLVAAGGWRLVAVGGWWRLATVGSWKLVIGGGWRLVAVGGWKLAVGGGWRLAVGGTEGAVLKGCL